MCQMLMCDTFQYIRILIFSFIIVIQYWFLGVSIRWSGQFSKPVFFLICLILCDYNKLVCIILIHFFYHFLTGMTKQDVCLFTLHKYFNYSFKYRETLLFHDIFGNNTQYYLLSHITHT